MIYTYEIHEAIVNAGHTYSPEYDGRYILRNANVRDIIHTLQKFLIEHGVEVKDLTRYERYLLEGDTNASSL